MIAWKLTTDFDTQRHLFTKKIVTGYVTESYICSCGHVECVVKHPKQNIIYVCNRCENEKFYEANSALQNIEHFIYQNRDVSFSYEYDIIGDEERASARYVTRIPSDIDYVSKRVTFQKKVLYSLELDQHDKFDENYLLRFQPEIQNTLKGKLVAFINKTNCFKLPSTTGQELTLKMIRFFLRNRHLKSAYFYYWDDIENLQGNAISIEDALMQVSYYPRAKSVKKAVYQNYEDQFNDYGRFNPLFIKIFTMYVKDPNVLVKFLQLKFPRFLYEALSRDSLALVFAFLKMYYTEKQLLKLFESQPFKINQHALVSDMVNTFVFGEDAIKETFTKVSCKVLALHDEFIRCTKKDRYRDMFADKLRFLKNETAPCIKISGYEVKLAMTGEELFEWGEILHNCIAGYFEAIKHKETLIYGFFQEKHLAFAVEIQEGKIMQASGKYNTQLTHYQNEVLTKWYQRFYKDNNRLNNETASFVRPKDIVYEPLI